MSILPRSSSNLWHHRRRFLRVRLFPTNASNSSFSSSSPAQIDTLSDRILLAGDSSRSIVPVLDQWLEQGKGFNVSELQKCVKKLRESCRHEHALQVLEWYTNQEGYKVFIPDVSVRLQLIYKLHGLEKAEEYFKSLPESSRHYQVYGVLLSFYPRDKQLEKAEAMMQNEGFEKTAAHYYTLLSLYSRMGKYEKLDILMQEMEVKGIVYGAFACNTRLSAYVACSDIDGMEKFLTKMEVNREVKMNFDSCIIAANAYLKAGLFDKTVMMLKISEDFITIKFRRTGYETLFCLHAAIGNKDDVYRLWDLNKQLGSVPNTSYVFMTSALLKLDDLDSAEKIWEEWDSGKNVFNIHIPNMMIIAYSTKGSMEKAEACIKKIMEKGEEPNAVSWDHLAAGYLFEGQMAKAVENVKKAILKSKGGWMPKLNTLTGCLEHLKGKGDEEAAEMLFKMINEQCFVSKYAYDRLSICIR